MNIHPRNVDDESYDDSEETFRDQDLNEQDQTYFPVNESKPPHY